MTWLRNNVGLIGELTLGHLFQSLPPILIGLLLAVPLGWFAHRFAPTRSVLLAGVSMLYVIPSLALFALLPPILGISFLSQTNLLIALSIYAVATMTRFVADGFASVGDDHRDAAVAVGYGAVRRFWLVELPLAGPVILSGLRVTAVSTISMTTVGVLIGAQNLGYLFTNGYQRQILAEVATGVVVVALLAFIVDRLLATLGRVGMPWARQGAGA